ncbi:nuclear transport factor 2 family protein [Albibacillus kandeliae]|uniref:DUF4440 domain-containing protein n=1 Tax=Albibacillus kandeliae TaxID=2174228 RepID=UPI000D6A0542|nr:DUF4440 domain-containing protein [Albibacillus kandeliae]
MTTQDDIWTAEEQLWTGTADMMKDRIAPTCLMAFPGEGLLQSAAIAAAIEDSVRWENVLMKGRFKAETDGTIVLGYTATGYRDGRPPYHALCTSTWRQTAHGWQMIQHQQTPI